MHPTVTTAPHSHTHHCTTGPPRQGGIDEMAARADRKSGAIYTLIDESEGFYTTPCSTIADRSPPPPPHRPTS